MSSSMSIVKTDPRYWDCECDENYIHDKSIEPNEDDYVDWYVSISGRISLVVNGGKDEQCLQRRGGV